MPRASSPLFRHKPKIEIVLTQTLDGRPTPRNLLADTGAGSDQSLFELIMDENDCLTCGGNLTGMVKLGGAYAGTFPLFSIRVNIPQLGFDHTIRVVGVPATPQGIDGIAGCRFLNRFTYGNFGDRNQFGLEL
ncbi:MAG: hypothetical protein K8T89_22835 [Planctomycetes bacterium]|nr:hypothetical protein [Planctomycetota bacterium]